MTIEAIIWDLDGTIIDTESPDFISWQEIYKTYGIELNVSLWEQRVGSVDFNGFDPTSYLENLVGVKLGEDTLNNQHQRYLDLCAEQSILPGVKELLDQAQARGIKQAIASNSNAPWVNRWVDHFNLRPYFTCIRTRDDITNPKPDPEIYLTTAACIGVPTDRCIAIEDSPVGMTAAVAANIRTIGVPTWVTANRPKPAGVALALTSMAEVNLESLLDTF